MLDMDFIEVLVVCILLYVILAICLIFFFDLCG